MTNIRKTTRNNVYRIHGTGNPASDDLAMSTLEAAIEASNRPAHIEITGDVHLSSGHLINMARGGGVKFLEGAKFTFHRGSYWGLGVNFTHDALTGSTTPITATAAGQAWIQTAASLNVGDWVLIAADNEYTGDYTRHGASIECRPMVLRRIIRQINSNSYALNKAVKDALTTNPRVIRIDMIPDAYVENMHWTFAPNETNGGGPLYTDAYQGGNNSGSVATLEADYPGSTTDDWAAIETGGDAGFYKWDGSNYIKVMDAADSTSISFDKVNNLRFEGGYAINPVPGAMRLRYCNQYTIRGLNHEQKHQSYAAVEQAGAGYGILQTCSEGGLLDGNHFDTCRHCVDTGGVSSGGHRYGNVTFTAKNNEVYGVGGSISAVPFSTHSEGDDVVFDGNRFYFTGGESNNTNNLAGFIRSRDVQWTNNKMFGPGGTNYSTRGLLVTGPRAYVAHNFFSKLGNGILMEPADGSGPDGLQATHNTFVDINGSALLSRSGNGEFSHNTVIDVANNRAGVLLEERVEAGGSGKKAAFVLQSGAGTEWRAFQNTIPKKNNDYAFDFGPITPSGAARVDQNALTGYGIDQPTMNHFAGNGSNLTVWAMAFDGSNWSDKFFDGFLAAVPSNPATQNAIKMEADGTPMLQEDGNPILIEE